MDTMLIFNHYIKYLAVNQTREAPRGNPSGSASETGFRQHPALVSLLSSRKKVDPNDFSPCIKQKIITVEFIFF